MSSSSVDRDVDMMVTLRQQGSGVEMGGYYGHFDLKTWPEGSNLSRVLEVSYDARRSLGGRGDVEDVNNIVRVAFHCWLEDRLSSGRRSDQRDATTPIMRRFVERETLRPIIGLWGFDEVS